MVLSEGAAKKRQSHKKSRGGCRECKRRHIKCDENRPICAICKTSRRPCHFASVLLAPERDTATYTRDSSLSAASPDPSIVSVPTSACITPTNAACQRPDEIYTLADLGLYSSVNASLLNPDTLTPFYQTVWAQVDRLAQKKPYVMDQLIALSALHQATQLDESASAERQAYRTRAAELRARSASRITTLMMGQGPTFSWDSHDTEEDDEIVSRFFVAAVISRSVFAERLASDRHDFSTFLDGLIERLPLLRGARIIASPVWTQLQQSPIVGKLIRGLAKEPTLAAQQASQQADNENGEPAVKVDEPKKVARMLHQSSLGEEHTMAILKEAHEALAFVTARINVPGANTVADWLCIAPYEFLGTVRNRVPEALVLMAHFAALLHQFRRWWFFGDAGEFIIKRILEELPSEWTEWLPEVARDM